jgi:hypothetical protein
MIRWLTKMASAADDSRRDISHDAGRLGEAWRQFVREDAAMTAPPELEPRVLAAWEALQHQCRQHPSYRNQRHLLWAVGAVACVLLLAVALRSHRATTTVPPTPASGAPVLATRAAGDLHQWRQPMPTADTVLTLTADPALETETLQLVRVRMPRLALQAVGVVVSGPNADGFVEVDVVVGEDGLPRDVRRVAVTQ